MQSVGTQTLHQMLLGQLSRALLRQSKVMLLSNVSFSYTFTAVCFLKRQISRWGSPEAMVTYKFKKSCDFFTYGNFSIMDVVECTFVSLLCISTVPYAQGEKRSIN
jgi:hypothetical protein